MSRRGFIALYALAAVMLTGPRLAGASDAKPTAKEVAAARSECSQHRRKAEKLEADPKTDPALLAKENSDWEHSCARAEALMEAAGMEKRSPPPRPPAPPPTIVIEKTVPANPPSGVIIDEDPVPPTAPEKP
jgi:hypothetical protein